MTSINNVLDVLDTLKQRGFSPADRAIVFSEWMQYSVHFLGDGNNPNRTDHHRMRERISNDMQQLLSNLQTPQDLRAYSYQCAVRNIILGTEDDNADAAVFAKANAKDFFNERLGKSFEREDFVDALARTGKNSWKTIDEMEMDEDDLQMFVDRKRPQMSTTFVAPENLTLDEAHTALHAALQRAAIPVCCIDPLTFVSPNACFALTKSVERVCDAFEMLGVEQFGLNGVDLNIVGCYDDGFSGFMDANCTATPNLPNKKPYVSVSNRCGWEFDEVLIHEYLHAHDALFNSTIMEDTRGFLLSDNPKAKEPIAQAWRTLNANIQNLKTHQTIAEKKALARQGIGQRWTAMGLDAGTLDALVGKWEASASQDRDQQFHKQVVELFNATQFAGSGAFRANVILAECKLLGKIDKQPVYNTFIKHFDDLYLKDTGENGYGRGYFEEVAERMARSIQSSLDVLPNASSNENPYAKRWLVYADQTLSPQITSLWQEFFKKECVQDAYEGIRQSNPVLSDLKERIEKRRQARVQQAEPEFKKAAL